MMFFDDEQPRAGSVVDALAEKGYIPDHLATDPVKFQEMVAVAAEALREHQRQIDLDSPV